MNGVIGKGEKTMTQLEFKRVKDEFGENLILLFEWGKFPLVIAVLNKYDIEKLNREWKEAK
jgi:hypothetical protein